MKESFCRDHVVRGLMCQALRPAKCSVSEILRTKLSFESSSVRSCRSKTNCTPK